MSAMGLLNSLLQAKQGSSSLEQLASSLLSGQNAKIGGIGALAGSLLGGGSSSVKGAMGGSVLAILGSLALNAYQNSQQSENLQNSPKNELMAGIREPVTPEETQEVDAMILLILKAMINAAKADGNIDAEEMNKIIGKAKENGLTDNEQQFIMEEINKPLDTQALITSVSGDPQIAAQVYSASLLAIDVDSNLEKDYLKNLAHSLGLSQNVVTYLHMTLGIEVI